MIEPSTPVDLDALERLLDGGTLEPWRFTDFGETIQVDGLRADGRTQPIYDDDMWDAGKPEQKAEAIRDALLIVALRNNAPALIRELREARAEVERLKGLYLYGPMMHKAEPQDWQPTSPRARGRNRWKNLPLIRSASPPE